jgi:hypothetical protein
MMTHDAAQVANAGARMALLEEEVQALGERVEDLEKEKASLQLALTAALSHGASLASNTR